MKNDPTEFTLAEVLASALVIFPALLILTVYVVDAAGWPIDPWAMLVLLLLEIALVAGGAWRGQRWYLIRLDPWGLAGFLVVIGGLFGYILQLAGRFLLPLSMSGDVVHHLSLIDFIQHRHSLVHDRSLSIYLGEMVHYPPGSHILAAMIAAWLDTTGVRVLHSLLALLVAIKGGIIYNVVLRLLPPRRHNPAVAVAAAALLLMAPGYFLQSFTAWYYYSQVVSETFAVAMCWALIRFDERPSAGVLAFFAVCGSAVWLTWPLWVAGPVGALAGLLLIRRDMLFRQKLRWLAFGVAPIALVAMSYALDHVTAARGVLAAGGSVLHPSFANYGWPLLALMLIGIAAAFHNRRTLPIFLVAGTTVAQTAVLWVSAMMRVTSYYHAYKMFYFLLYLIVLFAALGLDALLRSIEQWRPATRWAALAMLLPVGVATLAVQRGLPLHVFSAVTEPVYQAGLWTKAHLPNGCVDYMVDHWVTAYWLHVAILGNARATPRTDAITNNLPGRDALAEHWAHRTGLPYAIVGDLREIPPKIRSSLRILYESRSAAVVDRQSESTCKGEVPLDRYVIAPRRRTIARLLASFLPNHYFDP
jgi:hypothetical protein